MNSSIYIAISLTGLFLFANCSSAQKLQKEAPFDIETVYFQKWTSGVRGGGSGLNLFIKIENGHEVKWNSVYFRGKSAKLETIENDNLLLIGRFKTEFNQKKDIVMSDNPNEEFGNEPPIIKQQIPFVLKDSECVVSYSEGDVIKYYKIKNVAEKQPQNYPVSDSKKE